MASAADITRKAKSNLAFTFIGLPPDRREDLETFYAFCRVVDDLADDTTLEIPERQEALGRWEQVVLGEADASDELEREVVDVIKRRDVDPKLAAEIVRGCESDLQLQRFGTWEELSKYYKRLFERGRDTSGVEFEYRNFSIKVQDDMAWASFDKFMKRGEQMRKVSRELRVLIKEDGKWKNLTMMFVATSDPSRNSRR